MERRLRFAMFLAAAYYLFGGFTFTFCTAAADEQTELTERTLEQLSSILAGHSTNDPARWRAAREIARRKDKASKPLLIELLKDGNSTVRGAAAWGLGRIGGEDAQDALLEFLGTALRARDWGDLSRAAEAQTVLPDKRARVLLIQCLELPDRSGYFKSYAADALGKIGDPKAALPIARQLDINVEYTMSSDYLYLTAICRTKGREATPVLIDYLDRLVEKIAIHPAATPEELWTTPLGTVARQRAYNAEIYRLTISALEAVTGRVSARGPKETVAKDWKDWWRNENASEPPAEAERPSG